MSPSDHTIRRRSFIKRSIGTGAALALPNILTRPLFGAPSANGTVNLGLIGCGGISNYHKSNLKPMDDVRIIAVADAYRGRREGTAAELNAHYKEKDLVKAHADFREILARPDIDAVVIAAHDNWHTPMSIAALKAGKDVYCQKPLALDFSLTKLLREAVRESGKVFQFGTQYRSMGRYRQLIRLVRNGYIGKLEKMFVWSRGVKWDAANYHEKPYGSAKEIPVPEGFDFDAWMGPSEMVPYTADRCTNWGGYHCPETSLGFIAGCAIHELGLAQWGNKSDDTSPVRYEGTGFVPQQGIYRTLANWDVHCQYQNGVEMRLMDVEAAEKTFAGMPEFGGVFNKLGYDGVIFMGSEGWISDAEGFRAQNRDIWRTKFKDDDEDFAPATEHNRNFIDCVKSRKETMCPVEMAIRADTICHLASAAAILKRPIQWNPQTEEITNDPAATKMLSRPFRKEWAVWL
ncbi:MAG: Gfo/Idh/MocA family oxidoreductase [Akkermansiaceae bacterium]|nr:Gfo/Idh/MocA family oxidoreductase [Akkermansiaceae bacterium]MCF7731555.1 Gfo/Idh/MocA family oxidoreductase [Akkermansiaceae bacterium]